MFISGFEIPDTKKRRKQFDQSITRKIERYKIQYVQEVEVMQGNGNDCRNRERYGHDENSELINLDEYAL